MPRKSREMTLVADEGMRILMPHGFRTECPYFLASWDSLWNHWREIQRRGHGQLGGLMSDGYEITVRNLPSGGSIMRLEILFDPMEH